MSTWVFWALIARPVSSVGLAIACTVTLLVCVAWDAAAVLGIIHLVQAVIR